MSFKSIFLILIFLFSTNLIAQRVGFMSSDMIRNKFPEAQRAEQRIQSNVEEWKRSLEEFDVKIQNLELEIKKNRLIWTDNERLEAEAKLAQHRTDKKQFAQKHFEPGGEYDVLVKTIWKPIEEKIYAAVQEVAAEERYDYVFDKSLQPVPYTNYKYDLTISILKKLGVETAELEADLKKKISNDPRNKVKVSKERPSTKGRSRSRRSRSRSRSQDFDQNEIEQEEEQEQEEQDPILDPNKESEKQDTTQGRK